MSPLDREAENISSSDWMGGQVPNSSAKKTTRFLSRPPFSSATVRISRYRFWRIRLTIKYLVWSSSGSTIKMADFSLQNFSASMAVSKQRICSISESRKAFRRDSTVEITEAMACSAVLRADPANQRAL